MKYTGGKFDNTERNLIFNAGQPDNFIRASQHKNCLFAVNELKSESAQNKVQTLLDNGMRVFIDSGIFNLAMEHVRKTGITHDKALALAPTAIIGFDKLWDNYITIIKKFETQCWGYIELDQGGKENKIKTRTKLENLGLAPIPVYHPIIDGWDYFDFLATNYDRICVGNIVQASKPLRLRLIATIYERKRKYPNLFVHLLGYSCNEYMNAYPLDSCDSSSWLQSVRWSPPLEKTDSKNMGWMLKDFKYLLGGVGSHEQQSKSIQQGAVITNFTQRNWHNHLNDLQETIL